jgi:probable HAF family extracellular repeat protein
MMPAIRKPTSVLAIVLLTAWLSAATLRGAKPPKDQPPPPDISYSIQLLGTLGGSSEAEAMNERGDVVGFSETGDGGVKPFVYLRNAGTIHNLYDFFTAEDQQRWISWWPYGVNSAGQICGSAYQWNDVGQAEEFAVRFTPQNTDDEGSLVPARVEIAAPTPSNAEDINEWGDVTGRYLVQGVLARAFVFTDESGLEDLGDLGGGEAAGAAINNLGEVTGTSYKADGSARAFRFRPGLGMEDLGIIKAGVNDGFGNFSSGRDLNDAGAVVGQASAGARKGRSLVHAFRDAGQGMTDLATLGGSRSIALGINSHGEIVGWTHDKTNSMVYFLYTDEFGMVELEPLITNLPAGTDKLRVVGINDAGEICGTITFTDQTSEAFLLTPNP